MSKSARTRSRIQSTAIALFTAQGYDATTVDQIAATAGVSQMTFFRHFPTKDAVLLDDPYDPVIAACVARQPCSHSALERACDGLAQAWRTVPEADLGDVRTRMRIVTSHPRLRARMWETNLVTQRAITDALRASGAGRLEAEVAAGACMGALSAALTDWAESGTGTLGERITFALTALVPGAGRITAHASVTP
ncbi:TetR/AcrR family transcriptional regulator [Rhodococcus sp. NM-2]|uniref:TetR/AcrR family transcriptional regulator n=1 Tax=Rhodococcus sp. NM-2 TaxID=3401174 RepID=UPI003AAB30E2